VFISSIDNLKVERKDRPWKLKLVLHLPIPLLLTDGLSSSFMVAQPMTQIPQGKALRVVSVLERADENGEAEVCFHIKLGETGGCRVEVASDASVGVSVVLRGTGNGSALS